MFQAMALGARQRTVVTLRTRLNLILKTKMVDFWLTGIKVGMKKAVKSG